MWIMDLSPLRGLLLSKTPSPLFLTMILLAWLKKRMFLVFLWKKTLEGQWHKSACHQPPSRLSKGIHGESSLRENTWNTRKHKSVTAGLERMRDLVRVKK